MAGLRHSPWALGLVALLAAGLGSTVEAGSTVPPAQCDDPGTHLAVVSVGAIGDVNRDVPDDLVVKALDAGLVMVRFDPPTDGWVDDPGAGPALVSLIECLAARSTANGGLGRVALVPFSSGSLVARWAVAELARKGASALVLGVVTVAASDEGFWIDSPSAADNDARRLFASQAIVSCEMSDPSEAAATLCERARLGSVASVVNSRSGSGALQALPPWPEGVPVRSIEAPLQMTTSVFHLPYVPLPADLGDGAVNTPRAAENDVFECAYDVTEFPDESASMPCARGGLGELDETTTQVSSDLHSFWLASGGPTNGFARSCAQSGLFAVLNVAPGGSVVALFDGYRYEVRYAQKPRLDFFAFGSSRPRGGGAAKAGAITVTAWGDIDFDPSIRAGDRIRKGQVIGVVRQDPFVAGLGNLSGTVYFSATSDQGGVIVFDDKLLAKVFPFEVPTDCWR